MPQGEFLTRRLADAIGIRSPAAPGALAATGLSMPPTPGGARSTLELVAIVRASVTFRRAVIANQGPDQDAASRSTGRPRFMVLDLRCPQRQPRPARCGGGAPPTTRLEPSRSPNRPTTRVAQYRARHCCRTNPSARLVHHRRGRARPATPPTVTGPWLRRARVRRPRRPRRTGTWRRLG